MKGKSQSVARKLCREHYLSFSKMREWRDLRDQLETLCKRLELDVNDDRGGDVGLHRALLTGLLGRIGHRDPETGDYRGARGLRFSIFPGSGLFKKPPEWIMAGELVDTSRLYAREASAIDPKWLEGIAGDLCKRSYHSPSWDGEQGFVRATERVTLYGLVIVEGRRCDYTRINPAVCRELFIRHGLVAGDFPRPPPVVSANQELLAAIRLQEEKTRRQGQLLDEEKLVAFFEGRLPPAINSADGLRKWLKQAPQEAVDALLLKADDWMVDDDQAAGYPDLLRIGPAKIPLAYRHAPGEDDDGITCTATRADAALLRTWPSDWLVPGALPEKVRWMLGNLPGAQRRAIGNLADAAARCLSRLRPGRESLAEAMVTVLQAVFGVRVSADVWREDQLPLHLRVRFAIVDEKGAPLACGRDLEPVLQKAGVSDAASDQARLAQWHRDNLAAWSCGPLPEQVDVGRAGWPLVNYPALQDTGKGVNLRLFADPGQAHAAHREGVLRLLLLGLGREAKGLARLPVWPMQAAFFLKQLGYAPEQVAEDFAVALVANVFLEGQPEIRTPEAFDARLTQARGRLAASQMEWQRLVTGIITLAAERQAALSREKQASTSLADMQEQLAWLVFPDFVRLVPWGRLQHYPRYLEAIRLRLERYALNPGGDVRKMGDLAPVWSRYIELATEEKPPRHDRLALDEYRWMIEEFRVSLFAQELKTPQPISAKRLDAQWRKVV
jgi:ATP-dependent helicase HrpA